MDENFAPSFQNDSNKSFQNENRNASLISKRESYIIQSEWHGNNSVENRDAGIAIKLLNAQENAKYVAGYLAYIIDLWEQEYPCISCDAEVLATLYNIGEMGSNNAGPHPNPGSNEFGRFASDHRQLLQCLL